MLAETETKVRTGKGPLDMAVRKTLMTFLGTVSAEYSRWISY